MNNIILVQLGLSVAVIAAVTWETLDRRKNLRELDKLIEGYKKSNSDLATALKKHEDHKKIERWNIRLLRQEVIDLIKAKGGKL